MSVTPTPKPPPGPPKPVAGNPSLPAKGEPDPVIGDFKPHTFRIRSAVGKVDEDTATPTAVRSLISSYYRFVNPSGAVEHLPRSVKRHPMNPDHALNPGTRYDLFFHHLGSAIQALQQAYALDAAYASSLKTPAAKDKVIEAIALLEKRTARLEYLAGHGPDAWVVRGGDSTGYFLVSKAENTSLLVADSDADRLAEERRNNPRPIRGAEINGDAD